MFDQAAGKIEVGQTLAISVETGLRVGVVQEIDPKRERILLELDKCSMDGDAMNKKARRWYRRPKRVRIIAQPVVKLISVAEALDLAA